MHNYRGNRWGRATIFFQHCVLKSILQIGPKWEKLGIRKAQRTNSKEVTRKPRELWHNFLCKINILIHLKNVLLNKVGLRSFQHSGCDCDRAKLIATKNCEGTKKGRMEFWIKEGLSWWKLGKSFSTVFACFKFRKEPNK